MYINIPLLVHSLMYIACLCPNLVSVHLLRCPTLAYEISKSFKLAKDFEISLTISRFQDFVKDFRDFAKISGFRQRFLRFQDFARSVFERFHAIVQA